MAVTNSGGEFATVLRMKDEATPVVQKFGQEADASMKAVGAGAQEAAKKTEDAGTSMLGSYGKVGLAVGAAAAAVTTFGVAVTKAGIENADQTRKLAQQVGITTEQYSRLTYAFGLNDGSAQDLSKTLLFMEKTLANTADAGGKKVLGVLERLGLEVDVIKQMKPDEAFITLAESISQLENPMDRAQAVTALFGKSSEKMLNLIGEGTPRFRELMREADSLGIVVGTKAANAADDFNDSLYTMKENLRGVSVTVANSMAPAFADLSRDLARTLKESGALEAIAKALIITLGGVAIVANTVSTAFGFAGKIVGGLAAVMGALARGEFREAVRAFTAMADDLAEAAKRSGDTYSKILGVEKQIEEQGKDRPAPRTGRQQPGYLKKQSFEGDQFGGSFIKTTGLDDNPLGIYSDMLPGAEVVEERMAVDRQLFADNFFELEEMTQKHHIRLRNYDRERNVTRFTLGQYYDKLSLQSTAFFFGQMGALMQTNSRRMFEIGKAGAIAETIIQTYRAAQGAYAAMASIPYVGPALGVAAAAAAIAVGFARVQAINSTQYGTASGSPVLSSGGFSGPVVSGDAAVVPVAPTPVAQAPQSSRQTVNVYLSGEGSPTQSWLREVFVPGLNEVLGDGVELNVRTA